VPAAAAIITVVAVVGRAWLAGLRHPLRHRSPRGDQ
jgi:hypothetical protein